MTLVSILMPAYNAEKYIQRAIDSILEQTHQQFELLICDDCSSDSTAVIIKEYSLKDNRIFPFYNATNIGYLKTWNSLIDKAKGEVITFQDADDYSKENRVEILLSVLAANTSLDVIGSGIALVRDDESVISIKEYPTDWNTIQSHLLAKYSFPFCGSAVMVRKKVFQIVGGYREFFDRVGWEDHDWLIRVCEHFKAENVADILYSYRDNPLSVTRMLTPKEIRKLVIKDIGLALAEQRMSDGADYLMTGNHLALKQLIEKYEKPFMHNPALIYQVLAGKYMKSKDHQLFWTYLQLAFNRSPFAILNFKLLIKRLFS